LKKQFGNKNQETVNELKAEHLQFLRMAHTAICFIVRLVNKFKKDGKMITNTFEGINKELYVNAGMVKEEDIKTGWIYVLKSKSNHPEISGIKNLFKIGFSQHL
jgi:hypothetical protein